MPIKVILRKYDLIQVLKKTTKKKNKIVEKIRSIDKLTSNKKALVISTVNFMHICSNPMLGKFSKEGE